MTDPITFLLAVTLSAVVGVCSSIAWYEYRTDNRGMVQ